MNYTKLVPADSFMGRYLAYMQRQETAQAYDWWCGLWCIAAACARHVHVARPRAPVYLNMYVVLVGESGVPRKTTSVAMAANLVRRILMPEVGLIDAKTTPEKLDDILHDRTMEHGSAQLCIAIPELGTFLGLEGYIKTMPVLITDLYDSPDERNGGGTISRGKCIQRNIWVSLLSASTPIWLLKAVSPNISEGGFTSRCLFVLANKPKQSIAWPSDEDTADEYAWLLDDLRTIRERANPSDAITLTDGALHTFTEWYKAREHSMDPHTQAFESREDAHVLRVAALLCINDDTWQVNHGHITRAIELLKGIKAGSRHIFEGAVMRSKMAAAFDALRSELITSGMDPVQRSELLRKCSRGLNGSQFASLLDVVHELGGVQRFLDPLQDRGRTAEYFRGTELLLSRGFGDEVLRRFG